jgi:NADH-quinone oxidoreductase subunit M
VMPIYAAVFVVITMSSIGVPGTNGFVGEFMVIIGTFVSGPLGRHGQLQAVLAALGVILAAVYMLSVVQKTFFGPLSNPKNRALQDLNARESIALAPLVVLVFVIGLFPSLLLSRMTESTDAAIERMVEQRKAFKEMAPHAMASIRPRTGSPLEVGYPEPPGDKETVEPGAPPDEHAGHEHALNAPEGAR